jgi:hypothetical protein
MSQLILKLPRRNLYYLLMQKKESYTVTLSEIEMSLLLRLSCANNRELQA